MVAAAPAVAVAVKVMGEPESEPDVAVSVLLFVPALVPRVHVPDEAIPLASVICEVVLTIEPPPVATAKLTLTPLTGLLLESLTMTEGAVVTAVPTVAL